MAPLTVVGCMGHFTSFGCGGGVASATVDSGAAVCSKLGSAAGGGPLCCFSPPTCVCVCVMRVVRCSVADEHTHSQGFFASSFPILVFGERVGSAVTLAFVAVSGFAARHGGWKR
jgi:hypothetical protein